MTFPVEHGHENNLLTMIPQADHECCCSIHIRVLCICEARRREYNNHELGHTKQQEFSLKVSTERKRTWRRVAGFCPAACLVGESASLSRAVCGGPEDDSL